VDNTRLIILSIGIVMIVGFSLYSFMGSNPSSPKAGTKIQPVKKITLSSPISDNNSPPDQNKLPISSNSSIDHGIKQSMVKPSFYNIVSMIQTSNSSLTAYSNTSQNSHEPVNSRPTISMFDVYENRDTPENYYSIGFPGGTYVIHGSKPGSYIASITPNMFLLDLQDIPDDTNVQLYALTHAEPALKSTLAGYKLISTGHLKVGNSRAWDLVYTWKNSTQNLKSMKVFIEGQDQAGVLTFSSPIQDYTTNNLTVTSVLQSFRWLGQ
jgi:hypothetical protein